MRIHNLRSDIAGDVHVGKDDLDIGADDQGILVGYVVEETVDTDLRSLMVGLDEVGVATIIHALKLAAVGTALRTNDFGVGTVQCEDLSFTVWSVGGQVEIHPLWRLFYQGPRGLTNVVNSTDQNKNVDAEEELDNLVMNKIPDTVVLATPSIATLSGQKLSDLCMNEDHWWSYASEAGGESAVTVGKVQPRAPSSRLALAHVRRDNGFGKKARWPVAGASRHEHNDVSTSRNACFLWALWRVSRFLGGALPCASAKRSRLLPEVFDDCSSVTRRVSPRERAIIMELNETVFAQNFLETGGTVGPESFVKVDYSILFTKMASPALHRLHSVICDFRPPSATGSGEAALLRLLASRAIGGYSLTSDDPAPRSQTVFHSSRVARPQDASKAPYLVSLLSSSAMQESSVRVVMFLRLLTWKPSWDKPVGTLIQFSCTADDPMLVSFAIWLKLAPSLLWKMLLCWRRIRQ